jgi:hypothetical protein
MRRLNSDEVDVKGPRQLFESDSSYLPKPFQRETLYGWCARLHRFNSNASARVTSRHLFNDPVAGFRHEFPINLDVFSANSSQLLGTIEELIYGRTPFAIFAPFLPVKVIEAVVTDMRIGVHSRIKYQLGILPSRTGTTAPLKACPSCMSIDKAASRVAWWHVEHQWPTVMTCPVHGDFLKVATQEFHSRLLNDWFLPEDLLPVNWHDKINLSITTLAKLRKLTDWSLKLTKRYANPFDGELLRLTYHLRAKSLGWTAMDGSLKFSQIRVEFRDAYSDFEDLPGFAFIKDTSQNHGGFINSLLRQFIGNKHPLKHVLMMDFLFGDYDKFIAEYDHVLSTSIWLDKGELWAELTESRNQLKLLVSESGYSVNAAAKQLGLPVGQAILFLRQEGVEYIRRPRVLTPQIEATLCQLLEAGEAREEIASVLKIKKSFIRNYVQNKSELRDIWEKKNQERLANKYRSHFLLLLIECQGQTVKQMRRIPGNGIQWLLRHDKDWLEMNLPGCLWRNK